MTETSVVARDPFLQDYKERLQEVVREMKGVGASGLRLLIVEMIRSRWIKDKRSSYPYEVAWVLDRKEDGVARLMKELSESGDIEQVGIARGKKEQVKPYKPKTLRKTKPSR